MGRLWQKFYQNYAGELPEGEDIYGIYHNYESDDLAGAFDVVASWKTASEQDDQSDSSGSKIAANMSDVVEVNIPAGKYLVFSEHA